MERKTDTASFKQTFISVTKVNNLPLDSSSSTFITKRNNEPLCGQMSDFPFYILMFYIYIPLEWMEVTSRQPLFKKKRKKTERPLLAESCYQKM